MLDGWKACLELADNRAKSGPKCFLRIFLRFYLEIIGKILFDFLSALKNKM